MNIDFSNEGGIILSDYKPNNSTIIKVIGVGGGGGNAVNHMFNEGVHDVTYVVANTDSKALADSPVPNKLQLGNTGLGAGNNPEKGREAAMESIEDIRTMLSDGTKMVFITAGMGGGTGTGAAPVIAQCAKELGLLTVGIVTIPFRFEGMPKINKALDGVDEIYKHVDTMLVINNERLREIYPELTLLNAFSRADDTLSIAARGIAEIITMRGKMNLDFEDVKTTLKDGGIALMSTGYGEGENRLTKAINDAITSPLLNNNNIYSSKRVLLYLSFSSAESDHEMTMEEINEVNDFMTKFRPDVETKWGFSVDDTLDKKVKVTILASGFGLRHVPGMQEKIDSKASHEKVIDEDRKEYEGERYDEYYGTHSEKPTRRKRNVFIFSPLELDNDDIISRLESSPTCQRKKEDLNQIKSLTHAAKHDEPAPLSLDPGSTNSIVF